MSRAKDIDAIRELVRRQDQAKCQRDFYGENRKQPLDEIGIERQVVTYLGDNTTVADLTKHVEALEKEANERVENERVEREAREHKQRIRRVLVAGEQLAKGERPKDPSYSDRWNAPDKEGFLFNADAYVSDCRQLAKELEPKEADAPK